MGLLGFVGSVILTVMGLAAVVWGATNGISLTNPNIAQQILPFNWAEIVGAAVFAWGAFGIYGTLKGNTS